MGVLLAFVVVSCRAGLAEAGACLEREPVLSPSPTDPALEPGGGPWPRYDDALAVQPTTIDARDTVFSTGMRTDIAGVKLRAEVHPGVCLVGGAVISVVPEATWEEWHRHYGVQVSPADARVVGTRIHNVGDGIAVYGDDWTIAGVHMTEVHDDCVQNDGLLSGRVLDSFLDGCLVSFSGWQGEDITGHGNTVVIDGSIVRLASTGSGYQPEVYGADAHGGFFKWQEGRAPHLVIRNSVFRADQPGSYGGNVNGHLGLPPGSECSGVTLVGWEEWPLEEVWSWLLQCEDSQLGTMADWNEAVAAWSALPEEP